jgi:Fe-S cluster assembly iron-binding protein IscA
MQLIELTEAAKTAIKQYRSQLIVPDNYSLRIGIKQKNATDKGLVIGFDEPTEKDQHAEVEGIQMIYHPGQVFFFAGMVIDFVEKNDKKGFQLIERSQLNTQL